jgi:mannose-6-phosphate isomerase class I
MFYEEFPCRKVPTVMSCDTRISQMPHLSVASQTWKSFDQLINPFVQPGSLCFISAWTIHATLKGPITVCP